MEEKIIYEEAMESGSCMPTENEVLMGTTARIVVPGIVFDIRRFLSRGLFL